MTDETGSAEASLERAQSVLQRLIPITRPATRDAVELHLHLTQAWVEYIRALRDLKRPSEAVYAADEWIKHLEPEEGCDLPVELWPHLIHAMHEKALAQIDAGETRQALQTLETLQKRFEDTSSLAAREWVARAGLSEVQLRGQYADSFSKVDMARLAYKLAKTYHDDDWPATRVLVVKLKRYQAKLLADLNHDDEAISTWNELWQHAGASTEDEVREVAADAKLDLGRLLGKLGRWPEALESHTTLITTLTPSTHPGCRDTLALAMLDRVLWWRYDHERLTLPEGSSAQEQCAQACEAMQTALMDGPSSTLVDRCLSRCLNLHANTLRNLAAEAAEGDEQQDDKTVSALRAQAHALARTLWTRYGDSADPRTRSTALAGWTEAIEQGDLSQHERLEAYQAILARHGDDAADEMQAELVEVWANVASLQNEAQAYADAQATLTAMQQRFAQVPAPAIRRRLARLLIVQARWLTRDQKEFDKAFALLNVDIPSTDDEDEDRWLELGRLDALADLWASQMPAEPIDQNSQDKNSQTVAAQPTTAELEYAHIVKRMVERFATEPSLRFRRRLADRLYNLAVDQSQRLRFEAARATYQQYIDLFADDADSYIAERTASALLNQAFLLMMRLDRAAEALPYYDRLLARFGSSTDPRFRNTLAKASASRLTCLNRLQRAGVQVSYGEGLEDLPLEKREALSARLDEAGALSDKGKHREAIEIYDQVLESHVESMHPALRRLCLKALVNKGYCLGQLDQREQALAVNNEIIARYGHENNTTAEKDVALAYANKAVQLDHLGRHDEELATYDALIERWRNSDVNYLRMRVAKAMFAKGYTLADRDSHAAEEIYREIIKRYLHAIEVDVCLQAARSTVNLSLLLRKTGRAAEVASVCAEPLAQLADKNSPDIAAQIEKIRLQLARGYRDAGEGESAITAYKALLDAQPKTLSKSLLAEIQREYASLKSAQFWSGGAAKFLTRFFSR